MLSSAFDKRKNVGNGGRDATRWEREPRGGRMGDLIRVPWCSDE